METDLQLWNCGLCHKVLLDGDHHTPEECRRLLKAPSGLPIAGAEIQEFRLGDRPICEDCALKRGIPRAA